MFHWSKNNGQQGFRSVWVRTPGTEVFFVSMGRKLLVMRDDSMLSEVSVEA